jgi:type 1 glutamine amidotransferase
MNAPILREGFPCVKMRMRVARLLQRTAWFGLLLAALTAGLFGPALAKSKPPGDVHVLIVTGGHDFDEPAFLEMFQQMKEISFSHVAYGQGAEEKLGGDGAKEFDAIVFYDMHQDKEPQWKGIEQLLAQGKGILFLHHSLWSYDGTWPEYRRILGGRASSKEQVVLGSSPTSTYKHGQQVHVHIADSSSPVTKSLHDFDIVDETYNHYWVDPKVHTLLTTDNDTSEHVIGWSHKYKKSRIVYIELGHGPSAYETPEYRTMVQQAIFWISKR